MVFVALYGVLAIGMGLLMGHAGLFSLVHPTWFGLGAYVAGILSSRGLTSQFVGVLAAAVFVAVLAYIIGAPILKLRGLYLACASFGILIIAQIAFIQLDDLTGGHWPVRRSGPQSRGALVRGMTTTTLLGACVLRRFFSASTW